MKKISSAADLALNGAPPAFDQPLHVGRPNIGNHSDLIEKIKEVLDSGWLTNNGPMVRELEQRIANYLKVRECVAVCNGTLALEIAIRALGLHGEVILPSYTFVATAHALSWLGIKPVFADIDPSTHNLDVASVRSRITSQTRGIIGLHLWGRAAPIHPLQEIADEHGLALIFDAAHAFACSHKGQMIGNFGDAEVLSFHATKFFNTFEGGAVVTNDSVLAGKMRLMRNFGFAGADNVVSVGTNAKMTEVCAAMGLVNLDNIDVALAANRINYETYRDELGDVVGVQLLAFDEAENSNFQYIVLELDARITASRDRLLAALEAEGILARKYFWPGCHKMTPYLDDASILADTLLATESIAQRIIVLPTSTHVSEEDIRVIASVVRTFLSSEAR